MPFIRIVFLCLFAAISYGILHDQITARVCVEYFTVGHPPVFDTDSPTWLALGWGILATWWVGLLLGIPAAVVSRVGELPKFDAGRLIRPVCILLGVMGLTSVLAGVAGYLAANAGGVWLVEPLRSQVPVAKHSAFLADLWAHTAAYAVGIAGGVVLWLWILRSRYRMAISSSLPQ